MTYEHRPKPMTDSELDAAARADKAMRALEHGCNLCGEPTPCLAHPPLTPFRASSPAQPQQTVPEGYELVMVPKSAPGDEPDWEECKRQAEEATGLKVERNTLSILIREVRRWLAHKAAAQPPAPPAQRDRLTVWALLTNGKPHAPTIRSMSATEPSQETRDIAAIEGETWVEFVPAQPEVPKELDVRTILLDVVPGEDGMGEEVFAKTVADVEKKLSTMGEELEKWQLGLRLYPQPPAALVLDAMPNNWELSWGSLIDYDEESPAGWRVHRVSGGHNDREWTLIGTGATPSAAIEAALSTEGGGNGL